MPENFLSFHLPEDFIEPYTTREVPWGFPIGKGNYLGELTFLTKYSRRKPDGTKERWHETCRRVIEGMMSIQKDYCAQNRLPWSERRGQSTAKDAFERLFVGKWTPPGRGLWMMGTEFVNERKNSAALQNCAFLSTENISSRSIYEATLPFVRLMEMSMLGVGVGFDTKGAGKLEIHAPTEEVVLSVIEDTREAWCESTGLLLESYFFSNRPTINFDYSKIRPSGEPIGGFGGIAAGPGPLVDLHESIRKLFNGRQGTTITSLDILDIMNLEGKCVVAGNVRRSAEIALGDAGDEECLQAKNWEINPERMGANGWGHVSNNSVIAKIGGDYEHLVAGIEDNGEPGLLYLDLCQQYGRLIDPPNNKDYRAVGTNPCVTGDTIVSTTDGPRTVADLVGRQFSVSVNGRVHETTGDGFFLTGEKEVFRLDTDEGWTLKLTGDHRVLTETGWVEAQNLTAGAKIMLNQSHVLGGDWNGCGSYGEGYLLGHLWGDGTITHERAVLSIWKNQGERQWREVIESYASTLSHRSDWKGFTAIPGRDEMRLNSTPLRDLAETYGMVQGKKNVTKTIELASAAYQKGFLRAAFDTDGHVEGSSTGGGISIRLSQSDMNDLQAIQRMLSHFGVISKIRSMKAGGKSLLPDGKGGLKDYNVKHSFRLIVSGADTEAFMQIIGFTVADKTSKYEAAVGQMQRGWYKLDRPTATFTTLTAIGTQEVFDVTVPGEEIDGACRFVANGMIVHNCGEQTLESFECCTLVETFPIKHDDLEDYKKTIKCAYLYAKSVTLLPTHWPETNSIMQRNRRIGCSVSGVAQFAEKYKPSVLKDWLNQGYEEVQRRDRIYSDWLGCRESIKTTSVKPSGTVSLLFGVTPGVHWPVATVYIRRMRMAVNDPLLVALREAGYHTEPDVMDPKHSVVVELPTTGPNVRTEKDVTMWEKASLAVTAQRYWADNQVSVTVTFQEHEKNQIGALLRSTEGQLKSISMLPLLEVGGAYKQMPYESISIEKYEEMSSRVNQINWENLYGGAALDAEGERFCNNDTCEI